MELLLTLVAAVVVFGLCFAAIGVGIWIGKRKTIKGCSCGFDPDRRREEADCRRRAREGCACAAEGLSGGASRSGP